MFGLLFWAAVKERGGKVFRVGYKGKKSRFGLSVVYEGFVCGWVFVWGERRWLLGEKWSKVPLVGDSCTLQRMGWLSVSLFPSPSCFSFQNHKLIYI